MLRLAWAGALLLAGAPAVSCTDYFSTIVTQAAAGAAAGSMHTDIVITINYPSGGNMECRAPRLGPADPAARDCHGEPC
eukprot:SAG22_NODE_2797_length_2203_cov_1.468631_2_plen_79_part_00